MAHRRPKFALILAAALVISFAWLPHACAQRATGTDAALPVVHPVTSATLSTLLDSLRGRVVVLNVWATWCVPCVEEFPDLLSLADAYAAHGVTLVLVSADAPKDLDRKVRPFLRSHKVSFATWIKSAGKDQEFIDAVHPEWGGPIPVTIMIGRDGTRRVLLEGKQSYEEFERALAPLL